MRQTGCHQVRYDDLPSKFRSVRGWWPFYLSTAQEPIIRARAIVWCRVVIAMRTEHCSLLLCTAKTVMSYSASTKKALGVY